MHSTQASETCQLGVEGYVNAGQAWNERDPLCDLTKLMK
jgi:hypothetical protein